MGAKALLAALVLAGATVLGACGGGHTIHHNTVLPVTGMVHHTCYHTTRTKTRVPVRSKGGRITYKTRTVTHTHVPYSC